MKKRGITLLEIVIVLSITFFMVVVMDSMFISYLKNYKSSVLNNKGFNYISEAISIIEKEINQSSSEVKAETNIIKISYCDGVTLNYIKLINSNLYILYGTKYIKPVDSSTKNLIMDDVREFVAKKSGRILRIKVVWNSGQVIERCLVIQNAN